MHAFKAKAIFPSVPYDWLLTESVLRGTAVVQCSLNTSASPCHAVRISANYPPLEGSLTPLTLQFAALLSSGKKMSSAVSVVEL